MMKRSALAAISMLGGLIGAPAIAHAQDAVAPDQPKEAAKESGFYAGVGINLYFIDKDDAASGMPIYFEDQPSPGAFMGRVGYSFNRYFAVEAEAGVGGADSDFSDNGSLNGDIGVSGPLGAHAVVTIPFGASGAYVLGKAGYASVQVEREIEGYGSFDDVEVSGASFGAGGGFRSESWDFRLEYSFVSGDATTGVLGMFALRRF
ncbi:MAG: outer membrane beta-barrel protein [Terricaulis sp.]